MLLFIRGWDYNNMNTVSQITTKLHRNRSRESQNMWLKTRKVEDSFRIWKIVSGIWKLVSDFWNNLTQFGNNHMKWNQQTVSIQATDSNNMEYVTRLSNQQHQQQGRYKKSRIYTGISILVSIYTCISYSLLPPCVGSWLCIINLC